MPWEDMLIGDWAFVFIVREVEEGAQGVVERTVVRKARKRVFFEGLLLDPTHNAPHGSGRTKRDAGHRIRHGNIGLRRGESGGGNNSQSRSGLIGRTVVTGDRLFTQIIGVEILRGTAVVIRSGLEWLESKNECQ